MQDADEDGLEDYRRVRSPLKKRRQGVSDLAEI
jgi:hypothetical protein